MKRNIHKKIFETLKSKGILTVSAALVLVSCGIQSGAYTETDGVYYDPNKDTLPEGAVMNSGNKVGEYYDYQNTGYESQTQEEIVYDRYKNWDGNMNSDVNNQDSDWGNYTVPKPTIMIGDGVILTECTLASVGV